MARLQRAQAHAVQASVIVLAATVYSVGRAWATPEQPIGAIEHAAQVIGLERSLGLFFEGAFQAAVLGHGWLVGFFNTYYVYAHVPPLAAFLLFVYLRRSAWWPVTRDALLAFTAMGLLLHVAYPLAPPWSIQGLGIVDTVQTHETLGELKASGLGNPVAAMPSMHLGWAVLVGLGLVRFGHRWWLRLAGLLHPALMGLSIMATGNHYWLDAAASLLLVGLTVPATVWWQRRQRARAAPAHPSDPAPSTPSS